MSVVGQPNVPPPPDSQAALIASLRREIEDLRVLAQKPHKPWYRDGALLVALAAFIFTLVTWSQQDRHDTRLQLENVLKELYSMPSANADAQAKYGNTPIGLQVSQGLNAQNGVLSRQAYLLAEHLGRHLEIVERVAVASAIGMAEPVLAEKLLAEVTIPPEDIEDYLTARRELGTFAIHAGETAKGDENFHSAEDLFKTTTIRVDPEYVRMSNGLTEMKWGEAYLAAGNCTAVRDHFRTASAYLRTLNVQAQKLFGPQLENDRQIYAAHCPGTAP